MMSPGSKVSKRRPRITARRSSREKSPKSGLESAGARAAGTAASSAAADGSGAATSSSAGGGAGTSAAPAPWSLISAASRSAMSARPGATRSIFLSTPMALAALPERPNSSASPM